MTDELWTTRDGTRIAVADMDESHVRSALRLVLRRRRERAERALLAAATAAALADETLDPQDFLNDQHREALRNPRAFFPLLEDGVHGSEELYRRYGASL